MASLQDSLKLFAQLVNSGVINPNQYNAPQANRLKESLFGMGGIVPGIGDVSSAVEAADYWNRGEKLNAGLAGLGALPLVPSLAGVTKGQRLFRGTTSAPDPAHPVSRRFKNPGHEFGTHATVDPEVAGLFMEGGKQNRMHSLVSEVDKPLRLRDTGGVWSPDAVADEIRYNSKLYNERQKKMGEGFVPFEQLPTEMQDDLRSRGLDDMSALWHLKTGAPWLDRPDIGNKFSQEGIEKLTKMQDEYAILRGRYGANTEKQNALLDIYAKKMQKVIQEEGYDHISYKNVVEKNPRTGEASESVILFHPESVSLAPTEHIEYSDPFKDTTK